MKSNFGLRPSRPLRWLLTGALLTLSLGGATVVLRGQSLPQAQAQEVLPGLPTLDVRADFGARGDGRFDDTPAFARLAREVNRRGGGVRIVIPAGRYIVGGQTGNGRENGQTYRFASREGLSFANCSKPIVVEGTGAVLSLPDGLRFGSFDAAGKRIDPVMPFYNAGALASTGALLRAYACADVRVSGLELDGRNTTYVLGGGWGDRDRQGYSYGFVFDSCARVELSDASAHNFGLDGIYIKAPKLRATDGARPHVLRDCRFEWNGRQGLSWSGGIGLRASNCSFAHTGYAVNTRGGETIYNSPGAGVDIEAEDSVCRDGIFENCDFFHTRGPALYCQEGDNADVSFRGCRFWNFQNYSLVPNDPRLEFVDCRIYGAPFGAYTSQERPQDGARFVRCAFEDRAHPQLGQPFADAYGSLVSFDMLKGGLRLEDCTFIAHRVKGPYIRHAGGLMTSAFTLDGGSMRLEHFNGPGEGVATLQGGIVRNFKIEPAFSTPAPGGLHIWTDGKTKVGQGVELAGAQVHWGAPGGPSGALPSQE